ncbi:MAG TPA: phospholipid carrier-dependent glycosyltransferase [Usitatibacter sp.]|jgi:4-amino-4-deoxy-L-arabinose transferase-like glycosyltransferase|nr:phospholipid carrier-dependent glycosyltransferase [Usitatibacter sp.]
MSHPLNRAALLFLTILAIVVGIDNLGRPLANPDEGRYSEISREMVASGDWITPRLNGIKYFEKPPLQYWGTAASLAAFGNEEFAARAYVALSGLATILVVGYTGRRLGTPGLGLASILALLSCPYFMALGGIVTLDMGLTLWTTATLCAYLLAESAHDPRSQRRWMIAAWAAMALAVLSKGLVGIVFPAAAIGLNCILRRDFSTLARLEWGYGIVVFLAIAAPWFVAVSYANPEFAEFFFIHEHFTRFLTHEHRRTSPWWYFLPILFAGFLPWMFALPAAVIHGWRSDGRTPGVPAMRLAIVFSAFVVLFFSASGSKLPAYIVPAFPPLALVLGRYLVEAPPQRLTLWMAPIAFVAVALAVVAWQAPERARDPWTAALYHDARPWALAGAAVLFLVGLVGPWLMWRGRRWDALLAIAIGTMVMVDCLEDAYERIAPRQSGLAVAEKMRPLAGPGTRIYSVGIYDQTVPFYIARTVTLVHYVDEFEIGLRSQPDLAVADLAQFRGHWLRPGEAMAIIHPDIYQALRAQDLPMQLVHEDPRRVLVRKP